MFGGNSVLLCIVSGENLFNTSETRTLPTEYHPGFFMPTKAQCLTHEFLVMPNKVLVISMVSTQLGWVATLALSQKGDLSLILSDTKDLNSCPLTLKI